jgi:hypothetical protein
VVRSYEYEYVGKHSEDEVTDKSSKDTENLATVALSALDDGIQRLVAD